MQEILLTTIMLDYIEKNGSITSKELKDQVHNLSANKKFENNVFSQFMASTFLSNYFFNPINKGKIERRMQKVNGNITFYEYRVIQKNDDTTQLSGKAIPSEKPELFELNNGSIVCYNRNNPLQFAQSNFRKDARTAVKRKYSIKNADDINTCSAVYFKKVFIDRISKKKNSKRN